MTLEIAPVAGVGEIRPGDDLAALITDRADLTDGDVVVVSQKVVSKSEGALAPIHPGETIAAARRRLARAEARRTVVDTPGVLIVETRHGWICANAGVDSSNVDEGWLARLPEDADASARALRAGLSERGLDVAVVVADTFGRPWRRGQTDVAIGLAGLPAVRDERGGRDRSGQALEVTEAALADEVAAAADLVRTKESGAAVVVVRGLDWEPVGQTSARELQRARGEDLFPRGRGMLARELAAAGGQAVDGDAGAAGGAGSASGAAGAGGGVRAEDARIVERVAAEAGARLVTLPTDGGHAAWRVDGDRLAGGLAVAALRDLGYDATWRDDGGALVVGVATPGAVAD